MPAPMLGSRDKEEGLRHIRLALGAVLGGAGTNMMGKGQTVSPPLAEGGEHIAAPKKWTSHRGPPGCLKGWTVRLALGRPQNCLTRDIWCEWLPLHTLLFDGFVDVALRAVGVPGDLWFMLWLLALMGSTTGCTQGRARPTFYCAIGLRTPHTLHILRSWFLLLYW